MVQIELRAGDRVVLGGPEHPTEWVIVWDSYESGLKGKHGLGEVLVAPVVDKNHASAFLVEVTEVHQPDHVPAFQVNRMARYLGGLFPASVSVSERDMRYKPMRELLSGVYVGSVSPSDLEKIRERRREVRRLSPTPTLDAIRDIVGQDILESIFAPTRDPNAVYT